MKKYRKFTTIAVAIMTLVSCIASGCGNKYRPEENYRNYYEIFVGSFYDSDGDGSGDINGITQKLDYIEDLGCNGIWLTPIMPADTYHKYDVMDYKAIDSSFGTVEDFEKLVKECHKKDIKIIIDMVINHSSSKNPWFIQACDYLKGLPEGETPNADDCSYVNYYHFEKDNAQNGWCNLSGTPYYYECVFWDQMPDLNLADENLLKELESAFDFWIDLGVDGFRMDAPLHYEEGDTDFNTEALNRVYEYCKGKNPNFYMVSEVWASESTISEYYKSKTPSFFNFELADAEGKIVKTARGTGKAESFVKAMSDCQDDFAVQNPEYIDAPFIANHDMARVANNLTSDERNIKFAAGLLSTMSGNTFLYYGEEIGMKSKGTKDENKRLPMLWYTSADGVSSKASNGITMPPADADKDIEQVFPGVIEQDKDSASILNYYRKAFKLRLDYPAIAKGKITIEEGLTEGHKAVIKKQYGDEYIFVAYNTSDEPVTIDISGLTDCKKKICDSLNVDEKANTLKDGVLTLEPKSISYFK